MKPLIVSTATSVSATQAMSYARRSASSPVPIEADERLERRARGRWRDGTRGLEVRDDARQRRAVPAADAVDLFAQTPVGRPSTGAS